MTRSEDGPDGLLLVDKPEGPTSHDVVRMARKALRTRRVGHAGTLDPFATGLLICGVGRATRLLRWFSSSEKTYEGIIRLGWATDSGDRTGVPLHEPRRVRGLAAAAAGVVAARLTGELMQVPPMHSAKKVGGVALHELARRGESIDREPVPVRVHGWSLEPLGDERLRFRVTCSAGTYVRVLAADLGGILGCGAHLLELRRVASGALRVEDAIAAADLAERGQAALVPLDDVPLPLPEARCADPRGPASFAHGAASPASWWGGAPAAGETACRDEGGALLGVGTISEGALHPLVVLVK